MHHKLIRLLGSIAVLCCTFSSVQADAQLPVQISADSLVLNQKNQSTTYRGNVVLTQGEMTLNAEELTVFTQEAKLLRIEMKGSPATLRTTLEDGKPVSGQGNSITFYSDKGLLILEDNAALNQQGNTIASATIEYNLNDGNLSAGGEKTKSRVEVTFQPQQ